MQEYQKTKEEVRLNKYLSEAGVCSRREADRLIESGRVSVDGKRAQTGMKIVPGQVVKVGKKVVSKQDEMVVLAVNKPGGNRLYRRAQGKKQYCAFSGLPDPDHVCRASG